MLLDKMNIQINNKLSKAASFTIERFFVPEDTAGIKLNLQVPSDYINFVLLYDSAYNLRAEITQFQGGREIRVHELDYLTSPGAKKGVIPSGEWILAFEFNEYEINESINCIVEVSAQRSQ
ncbi:hypothetical protein ACF3NG_08745 [Aerococcaceae bacterium WGS1372]